MRPPRSLLLVLLAACGGPQPAPATPPAPAPPPAATPAAQAPSASAAAPAAAAPGSAAVPAPPEPPSPFHPALIHVNGGLRYYQLGKVGLAVVGDYYSVPIRVDDQGARIDRSFYQGLKGQQDGAFLVTHVLGDWPKRGSLALNLPGERGGTDIDYEWNGSSWVQARRQRQGDMPPDVNSAYYLGGYGGSLQWGERTLYYIQSATGAHDVLAPRFVLGGKGTSRPAPVVTKGQGDCPTRLVGYLDLLERPSGEFLGVGKLCTGPSDYVWMAQPGPGALAVERWQKGATRSTIEELPGSAERGAAQSMETSLRGTPSGELYVITQFDTGDEATPYVARHDGKAWTDVSPKMKEPAVRSWIGSDNALWLHFPRELSRLRGGAWERIAPAGVGGEIKWVSVAPDGALWARIGAELWRWSEGAGWAKVSLPRMDGEQLEPESVEWAGPDDMLVLASSNSKGMALLRSKKPGQVLDLEAALEAQRGDEKPPEQQKAFGRVTPPTASCKDLFVILYRLSKVAPRDFDFPLTREALKGHTEYADVTFAETEDGGRRYLVAFVPSLKKGQQLAALIRDKVKGSTPQLLCGRPPQTNRTLSIDLRTGALTP